MNPPFKYRIGAFKAFMPDWARFTTLLLALLLFQVSGAVYLGLLMEMVGDTGFTTEDVKMLAGASFCGTTVMFPLLFRLKFRFMSKQLLLAAGTVVILGNLVMLQSRCLPLLLATSFVVGMGTLLGIFECVSSIQLVVTPTRNLAVFFSFLFLCVLGSIQLSGLLSAYCADAADWRRMHLTIVAAHTVVLLFLAATMRPFRFMKKMPLYGIDWLGLALWGALLLVVNFILEYGRRLDWLDSEAIRAAIAAAIVLGACTWLRMMTARRPYLSPSLLHYRNLRVGFVLYIGMQLLLAPSNVVLPAFTGAFLHYDLLHSASLNWAVLGGIVCGAALCRHWLASCNGAFKPLVLAGFFCLTASCLLLHGLIAPSIPKESLYLPFALRGAGQAILFISLNVYMASQLPFAQVMSGVMVFGIVRTAIGGTFANSVTSQLLEYFYKGHRMVLGQGLDAVDSLANSLQQGAAANIASHGHSVEEAWRGATGMLYGKVHLQAMLVSWKDLLAWWTLLGVLIMVGIAAYRYVRHTGRHLPTMLQMAARLNPLRTLTRSQHTPAAAPAPAAAPVEPATTAN